MAWRIPLVLLRRFSYQLFFPGPFLTQLAPRSVVWVWHLGGNQPSATERRHVFLPPGATLQNCVFVLWQPVLVFFRDLCRIFFRILRIFFGAKNGTWDPSFLSLSLSLSSLSLSFSPLSLLISLSRSLSLSLWREGGLALAVLIQMLRGVREVHRAKLIDGSVPTEKDLYLKKTRMTIRHPTWTRGKLQEFLL
jgi:hypothetical protein